MIENNMIRIFVSILLLTTIIISGCLNSNEDSDKDKDGVPDKDDLFPNDISASIDTDLDGYPDSWNEGYTKNDTTTGLSLDNFPSDRAASLDSDDDGFPDSWNTDMSELNSTTGLTIDAFPDDPAASKDTDEDGYPEQWNAGKDEQDTTTGIEHIDHFPNDIAASLDSDGDGYPDSWNENMDESDSTTSLIRIDAFPFDLSASLDEDGDGYPDEWNAGKDKTDSNTSLDLDIFPKHPRYHDFDSLDIQCVNITPGKFQMGLEYGFEHDSIPQHNVTLTKSFKIMKYEVIQDQWKAIMDSNPSHFKGSENPVERITWNDCQTFIQKLNALNPGNNYRLPTEAEWEYCCRAGTNTTYSFGDDKEDLEKYGWFSRNSDDKTHPVGEKLPNPWGLYDIHGNVWEWCNDWYHEDYYDVSPEIDPQGPETGTHKVTRGGGWYGVYSNDCTSTQRFSNPKDDSSYAIGIRLVCD